MAQGPGYPRSRTHQEVIKAYVLTLAALLSGCAPGVVPVDTEGKIDVLEPTPEFAIRRLSDDWVIEGRAGPAQAFVATDGERRILKVSSGRERFLVVRRIQANLLATPYLTWSWNMEPEPDTVHSVRIVIGSDGGGSSGGHPVEPFGTDLPRYDRAVVLAWGVSALMRGSFDLPAPTVHRAPVYLVRGGIENTGKWWQEAVDLGDIYRRLWPDGEHGQVRVASIGIAAAATTRPGSGSFSGIRLSR